MTVASLHRLSPIFQVANLQRGIDFYTQVMGFEARGILPRLGVKFSF